MKCEFCKAEIVPLYPVSRDALKSTMHRCPACCSCRLEPPFPADVLHEYYENTYFQAANWEIKKSGVLAADYYEKVRPFFNSGPGIRSVDVGGGFGHFARYFASHLSATIDVVEPSASCRKVMADHQTVGEVFTSLEEVPKNRKYDQVFCFHVVEHLQEFSVFARRIRERLESGGKLFILTPNGAASTFLRFGREWGWSCPEQHYQFLSSLIPQDFFSHLGFKVVRQAAVCPAIIHYPSWWLIPVQRHIQRLNESIQAAGSAKRFTLKVWRKAWLKISLWLQQNRTNFNLCLIERFLIRQNSERVPDELLLVLEKCSEWSDETNVHPSQDTAPIVA